MRRAACGGCTSRRLRHPPSAGPQLDVPQGITPTQLEALLNGLLSNEEGVPYSFYIEDQARAKRACVLAAWVLTGSVGTWSFGRCRCWCRLLVCGRLRRACAYVGSARVPQELGGELGSHLLKAGISMERALRVTYMPQAVRWMVAWG